MKCSRQTIPILIASIAFFIATFASVSLGSGMPMAPSQHTSKSPLIACEKMDAQTQLSDDCIRKTLTEPSVIDPTVLPSERGGFVLKRVKPDSVYSKLGLMDGDVIQKVNETSLLDAEEAIKALNSLKVEEDVNITLQRNGKTIDVKIKSK